jgi:hypothetical protein
VREHDKSRDLTARVVVDEGPNPRTALEP